MTQEEFDAIVANNTERRNLQVTEAANGFSVQGIRGFFDPISGQGVFQASATVVAASSASAVAAVTSFLETGSF